MWDRLELRSENFGSLFYTPRGDALTWLALFCRAFRYTVVGPFVKTLCFWAHYYRALPNHFFKICLYVYIFNVDVYIYTNETREFGVHTLFLSLSHTHMHTPRTNA